MIAAADGVEPAEMKLLIVKAQSFKSIAKQKEAVIKTFSNTIEKIQEELKSL